MGFRFHGVKMIKILTILLGLPLIAGASSVKLSTEKVLSTTDIVLLAPGATIGDKSYAQVNSAALPAFYKAFRNDLHRKGVVRWDERFSCKHFAGLFVEMAQVQYFNEAWKTDGPAALAIGAVWYVRDNGRGPHALVCALTERGRLYIEPQSGECVTLSEAEERSVYFRFF